MRIIITFTLLIVFHQLLTRVAYGSVNMFLGSSFCQRIIQQDVTKAVRNVCPEVNINDPYEALAAKLQIEERKIDDALAKFGYLQSVIGNNRFPNGYEYYQQDKFLYKFHKDCKSWPEARQACQQEGGDLISLNENNFDFFRNVSKSKAGDCQHVWVGAASSSSDGQWYWLNGKRVSSVFWQPAQPDNYNSNENCGDLISFFDFRLNDHVCNNKEHYFCQIV